MASSGLRIPTPFVRPIQMRLTVRRSSYSFSRDGKIFTKWRTRSTQPRGRSSSNPPMRIELYVSRAPQKASNRSRIISRSRKV